MTNWDPKQANLEGPGTPIGTQNRPIGGPGGSGNPIGTQNRPIGGVQRGKKGSGDPIPCKNRQIGPIRGVLDTFITGGGL